MRTRLRFLSILIIFSISLWLMISLYNVARDKNDSEKWPAKIPDLAEPLVGSSLQVSSIDLVLNQYHDAKQSKHYKGDDDRHHHYRDSKKSIRKQKNHEILLDNKINSDSNNILQFPFNQMNSLDTIFYQFDMKTKYAIIPNATSQSEHEREARDAGIIKNEVDNHVHVEGDRLFAFNLLASNRIGFFRSLPDTRHHLCKATKYLSTNNSLNTNQTSTDEDISEIESIFPKTYPNNIKPKASIIICYYNEAPSALLRTIITVIRRSPSELLREIIIIDDFSDKDFHFNKIKPFIEEFNIVQLHRTERREGLIRARLLGSKLASGEVLIFLDSHVEANEAWLEPLMYQIQFDRTTVACPMIDLINPETMIYTSSPMVVGATSWSLHFKWISVASEKLSTKEDFIKPLESPTMAGGLYAIDKEFFHHLGEYDPGMELWGGENVEISFRIWLCGGRVVVLSCSRVGHIFRKRRPYGPAPDKPDCLLYNSHRAARVWLGDYIEHFYKAEPGALNLDSGDVADRLSLKEKLGCKNFDWYINNVYRELGDQLAKNRENTTKSKPKLFKASRKRIDRDIHRSIGNSIDESGFKDPKVFEMSKSNRNSSKQTQIGIFLIQAENSNLCVKARESPFSKGFYRLILGDCPDNTSNNMTNSHITDEQHWFKTMDNELRLAGDQCLDLIKNLPLLRKCHNLGYFQTWLIGNASEPSNIYNIKSGLCLAVERPRLGEPIIVTLCDKNIHDHHPNKIDDNMKLTRQNMNQPFWNTGPDMFSQVGKLRFLAQNSPMPLIQRWKFLYV